MKNQQSSIVNIDINAVKSRMLQVRGQQVLLDRDVAALYDVETRVVNQAVKNNPDKFPAGYVVELTQDEIKVLRSKILTLETTPGSEIAALAGVRALPSDSPRSFRSVHKLHFFLKRVIAVGYCIQMR